MVEKTFCDRCGEEIKEALLYEAEIYDKKNEKTMIKKDLCCQCCGPVRALLEIKREK